MPASPPRRLARCIALLVLTLLLTTKAKALDSDQLLLVVNQNVPESVQLADFYRVARQVPAGRIVSLDLPTTEEIAFPDYERRVIPPLREFLRAHHLEQKIKCLVTFYGVPLRIGPHALTAGEKEEIAGLEAEELRLLEELKRVVHGLEGDAEAFDKSFRPAAADDLEHLLARAEAAFAILRRQLSQTTDLELRVERTKAFTAALQKLGGPAAILRIMVSSATAPAAQEQIKREAQQLRAAAEEVAKAQELRYDPEARAKARQLVGQTFGLTDLIQLVRRQLDYLQPDKTEAALDNELPLLWWDYYRRSGSLPNLMYFRNQRIPQPPAAPRQLMVMRLDAPQAQTVRDMILGSLKAERDGLIGKVVLDARGMHADDKPIQHGGYVWYDQSLRDLADLIKTKTSLPLLLDDTPQLLPENSASDVALYCGWYSVRKYVPCCRFVSGAVAFHVASYELVSLRGPNEQGWCRGLLNDGVAATLGSVAEPYLGAFPAADEFFPLLLTGKLTLAEVYWSSNPATSWMMVMIGDPLYTPYKKNPALAVTDLPDRLQIIFHPPATQPASAPAGSR